MRVVTTRRQWWSDVTVASATRVIRSTAARNSSSLIRANGTFFTSCGALESAVATRGLAAVPRERAVEGVLRRVADLSRDRPDRFGGVLQPLRREVHAPAREVGQRRLAHDLREAPCECRAREVYLACERLDRPWFAWPGGQRGDYSREQRVPEGAQPR